MNAPQHLSRILSEQNTRTRQALHRAAFHQDVDRRELEREACEHALRAALIIYGEWKP